MLRLLRRKIYKPKLFPNEVGRYIHRSNESLDTISSSREEVMTPNTLDLMNGHANNDSSADVTSTSEYDVTYDPHYAPVDPQKYQIDQEMMNKPNGKATFAGIDRAESASPYENASTHSDSPLDVIIADLQNVGNVNLTDEHLKIEEENKPNGRINHLDDPEEEEPDVLDFIVPVPNSEPLYSVIKKKNKSKPIIPKEGDMINTDRALKKEKNNNDCYSKSKTDKENMELSALLESIVSEMDIFVSDGSEQSNEELKSYNTTNSLPLPPRKNRDANTYGTRGKDEQIPSQSITNSLPLYPRKYKDKKNEEGIKDEQERIDIPRKVNALKSESTPNLPRKLRHSDFDKRKSGYDSDTDAHEDDGFSMVDPQKKSVSFNDFVLEIERPRSLYSTESSDYYARDSDLTDVKKTIPYDNSNILTTNIDSDSQCGDDDMYRSNSVMSYDLINGQMYAEPIDNAEVVAIFTDKSRALSDSDDMLSVAAEDDVYSDTETDDEMEQEELYVPLKVRRHGKSRTALLLITWLLLGMSSTLPGTVMPYLAERINTTWEPLSRGHIAKGGGYFIGSVIAGIAVGVCHVSVELVIIVSLLAGALGLVTVPWFSYLVLFCGSNAVQGMARGLLQVGSHLYLINLWNENTGVKLIHSLYIVMAAGSALIPQIARPMMQSPIADDIYHYIDSAGVEDILRMNGYDLVKNGSDTVLMKKSADVLSNTASYNDSMVTKDDILTPAQRLYILYFIVAVVPLFCGLVFLIFLLYTCVQTCRKKVKDYSHGRKLKKINKLKDKIAQSRESVNSFQHLNGKPGESVKGNGKNGKLTENGKSNGTKNQLESGNNLGTDKSNETNTESSKLNKTTSNGNVTKNSNGDSTEEIDHVNHVTSIKKKVSFRMTFWERKRADKNEKKQQKKKKKKHTSLFLREKGCSTGALMYLYVFFCLPIAAEIVFSYFIYIYAMQSPLTFTELQASLLLSLFWICMLLSRVLIIPIAKLCPPNAIITPCLVVNIMITSILASYGWRYPKILWVFTALFGFFLGPILPGGFTWANIYLKHTAKCLALAYCLAALGMALFAWTGGMVLQYYGYKAIMYVLAGICVLAFLLFLPTMRFLKTNKVFKVKVKTGEDKVYSTSQRTYI